MKRDMPLGDVETVLASSNVPAPPTDVLNNIIAEIKKLVAGGLIGLHPLDSQQNAIATKFQVDKSVIQALWPLFT